MDRALARAAALFSRAIWFKVALAGAALCCATGVSADTTDPQPPDMKVLSPGKVDMVNGNFANDVTDLSIGPDGDSLDFVRAAEKNKTLDKLWTSNWHYVVKRRTADGGWNYTIENSAVGKTFYNACCGTTFADRNFSYDGVTTLELVGTAPNQFLRYTATDGTIIDFEPGDLSTDRWAQSVTRPDGLKVQFQYDTGGTSGATRLRRVYDNRGYILILEYSIAGDLDAISKVCAINAAVTTPPSANTCPVGVRSVSYTYNTKRVASVTDPAGKVSTVAITLDANGRPATETYYKPGIAQAYLTVSYGGGAGPALGTVVNQQVFGDGPTYTYTYGDYGSDWPNVEWRGVAWDEASNLDYGTLAWGMIQIDPQQHPAITPMPLSINSAATGPIAYTLNPQWSAVQTKQLPSGLVTRYTYATGNAVSQIRSEPPGGSTDPQIATNYTYDGCTNAVTCHKPITKTDPRGNTTNYTYDPVHGGILTETEPAPAVGGVRPQKRYTYQQLYARYKTSTGTVVQAPTPTWKLTQISECRTTASCASTADEVRTVFTYPSGSGAFNLNPVSKTVQTGTGTVLAITSWTYDSNGDKLTEDGPLAGTADTTRWRYDAMRRVIGVIGPDPDGVGALKNRAVRNTYDDAGRLTMVERGTVNSQSDADWAAFVPLERETNSYDLQDRLIKTVTSGKSGASFVDTNVTQMKYDAVGQLICRAVRMDPSQWNSQTDACVPQTTGPNGPDRITKFTYDARHRAIKKEVGYGTAIAAAEETNTWTVDSKLETVTDGEGNTTTYEYDGHDRLIKTRFPVETKGALASSATDYEQLTLDLASNVTAKRLRDGQTIAFTYDNLNRVTLKDLPGSDPDVTYAYDNLDQLTSASQAGHSLSYTYDPLGRLLTETGPLGTVSSAWDAAGRRTTLTYPGGDLTVNYDYLVTGEMQKIRENGATSGIGVLATYAYDDLGRRTSLTRGNGTVTSSTYDPVSRLTSMTQDLSGTTNDLSITGFGYNPANQITGYTRSNDSYAWTESVAVNRGYNANGLNQYSSAGAVAFAYDARGNLTSDGSVTFGYDSENKLISTSGAKTGALTYDPKQRLYQLTGAATTRFAYDGADAIAEYDGTGALLRRYVNGPSDDDPLVQYETSGLTDRRWLHTDEHGSIVATSDAGGNMLNIDTYDEYGIPGSTNAGRFQYTGQMWLSDLGLYHYKARSYSPTLGRFLQTDPTGYEDGTNWYAYVDDDPVNGTDPTGMNGLGANEPYLLGSNFVLVPGENDDSWEQRLGNAGAAAGAVIGGFAGGIGGGTFGASAGALCGPGAVACSPAGAVAGGAMGATVGAGEGAIVGGTIFGGLGRLVDKGIALLNKPGGDKGKFTTHAQNRMGERGISDGRIQEALKIGRTRPGNSPNTIVKEVPSSASASGRGIKVVLNKQTGKIVTVIDKGSKFK